MDVLAKVPPGYELDHEIARTRLAIVYSARHEPSGRRVAMKLVRAGDTSEVEMLERVRDACRGVPRHVVRFFESHEEDGDLWIALELFRETLDSLKPADMTPLALMSISLDSSFGLAEMERAAVIDDDVKPANLAYKDSGRVAHIDLGGARLSGQRPHCFTPGFTAPEAVQKVPSDTSPCYGWARTIECLVTGKVGFGPDYALDEIVPWVGRDLSRIVMHCAHPDPNHRPTARELAVAVYRIVKAHKRCRRCGALVFHDAPCKRCG